ncbi:MAG: transglycosylase SLT domain-containing protein [Thermodesulfobacteriota bacterium]
MTYRKIMTLAGSLGRTLKTRKVLSFFVTAAVMLAVAGVFVYEPWSSAPARIEPPPPAPPAGPGLPEKIALLVDRLEKAGQGPPREDYDYVIQPGDSLIGISWKIKTHYGLAETPAEIRQGIIVRNDICDPKSLLAGDKLTVPVSEFVKRPEIPPLDPRLTFVFKPWALLDRCHPLARCWTDDREAFDDSPRTIIYTVQEGDTLYQIAKFIKEKEGVELPLVDFVQEIAARNDIENPQEVYPEAELVVALTNKRTMLGLLSYDGFQPRDGAAKLHYTPGEINAFIVAALKKYTNIPEQTFRRMMRVESGGNHMAISPVGAAGLMQLMPLTARKMGLKVWNPNGYTFPKDIGAPGAKAFYQRYARELQEFVQKNPYKLIKLDDRFNPRKNVYASARFFSRLVAQYGTYNAVAAYNGGHRGLTLARPRETSLYLQLVLRGR